MDETTSRVGALAALAVATAMALGACTAPAEPVGEPVGSWRQSEHDSWIDAAMPIETVALTTDAEREQWLTDHAGDAAADEAFDHLRAVDLDESFVVIGGYPRCTEYSAILLEDDGAIRFEVTAAEEGTDCYWSPYTIDAWAVPWDLTGGALPEIRHGDRTSGAYGTTDGGSMAPSGDEQPEGLTPAR